MDESNLSTSPAYARGPFVAPANRVPAVWPPVLGSAPSASESWSNAWLTADDARAYRSI